MNRCTQPHDHRSFLLQRAALLCLAVLAAAGAHAQTRSFPAAALRGVLQVTMPPEVLLDGHVDRLSPGARIRGPGNQFVMSGNIAGERLVVNYVRESNGLIHEVWLLSPEEAAVKRPGATRERNFIFGSEEDTRPRDDGKTPFHMLPKYGQ